MARTFEFWDDVDFAQGKRTLAGQHDIVLRIGDQVDVRLDLSDEHLAELIEHNAPWIELGRAAPGRVASPARGRARRTPDGEARSGARYWREVRGFAQATGRGQDIIRPGWTPDQGSKNKYQHPQSLLDEHAAWVAAGRPPLETWQSRAS